MTTLKALARSRAIIHCGVNGTHPFAIKGAASASSKSNRPLSFAFIDRPVIVTRVVVCCGLFIRTRFLVIFENPGLLIVPVRRRRVLHVQL